MFDLEKVRQAYPEQLKVYGPYSRKDGRQHVIVAGEGFKKTVSFPKFLKELELGTALGNLTVDHQDRDKTNNQLDNLVVRERSEHVKLDATRIKVSPVVCPICGVEFIPTKNQINSRAKKLAGPFCSRSCQGKYGKSVQMGEQSLGRTPVTVTKYKLEK